MLDFWILVTYHGKSKDILVEQWSAKTVMKNNIVTRQRGAEWGDFMIVSTYMKAY